MRNLYFILLVLINSIVFGQNNCNHNINNSNVLITHQDNINGIFKYNKYSSQVRNINSIKQKLDSIVKKYWDQYADIWEYDNKIVYEYYSTGNLKSKISSVFQSGGGYEPYLKVEYYYDSLWKLSYELFYTWNDSTTQWYISGKNMFTYNNFGYVETEVFLNWNDSTSQWENMQKNEYAYASGNDTLLVTYTWNNQWNNYGKYENSYNLNNNITEQYYSKWDTLQNIWVAINKREYTYSGTGKLTNLTNYFYIDSLMQWKISSKYEHLYDLFDNLEDIINSYWNDSLNQFDLYWKWTKTYNNLYNYNDLVLPWANTLEYNHMLITDTSYCYCDSMWKHSEVKNMYYSEIDVNSNDELTLIDNLQVFPNPSSDKFTIQGEKMEKITIFNTMGQVVKTINTNRKDIQQVNLGVQPKGIYLIKVETSKSVISKKIILN